MKEGEQVQHKSEDQEKQTGRILGQCVNIV